MVPFQKIFEYEELPALAKQFLPLIRSTRIVTFSGQLGAGKTTFIKAIVEAFGYKQIVSSPTFTYMQLYYCPDGTILCHFDLYRLDSIAQFFELGFDEYLFNSEIIIMIEWPERIAELLTMVHLIITLEWVRENSEQRLITARL